MSTGTESLVAISRAVARWSQFQVRFKCCAPYRLLNPQPKAGLGKVAADHRDTLAFDGGLDEQLIVRKW